MSAAEANVSSALTVRRGATLNRIGNAFLGLGVAIGLIGVSALVLGFRPSSLPSGLIDLSVYKLVFIASGCVLTAGALVRRAARRDRRDLGSPGRPSELPASDRAAATRPREEIRERAN